MSDKKICETKDGIILLNTAIPEDLKKLGQALQENKLPATEIQACTPKDMENARAKFPKPTNSNSSPTR